MKDFLQDRPLATGSTRRQQAPTSTSSLPPIQSLHSQPEEPYFTEVDSGNLLDAESHDPSACASPQVEIIPDEAGRIGHIVVTCPCGEKITLQCNY